MRFFSELWIHPKGSDSDSDVAISLGQAELKLGKYRDAAEHLSTGILRTPPNETDTKERAGKGLAYAKKKIGTLTIVALDGTELAINGKSVGIAPIATEVFVDPGSTTVTGKHPTKGTGESQVDVKAGEEHKVELQLHAEPESKTATLLPPPYSSSALDQPKTQRPTPSPIQITSPPPVENRSGMEMKTIVLIAGGVVTLAAAGTATYFGLKAHSARKDTETLVAQAHDEFGLNACFQPSGASADLCNRIVNKNNDRLDAARAANISFAITGVAAVATGLTYLLWPRVKTLTSAFVMVPIATPHTGGLSIQGDF